MIDSNKQPWQRLLFIAIVINFKIMSEFTANWNERIPKGNGLNVYEDGEKLGESEHEKGSWWSGWKYKDEYYIMLSDEYDACWKVDKKTVEDYCL